MALGSEWAQQSYVPPPGADLNIATILRIVSEWRWLIIGALAVSLAGAIVISLLTTPLYRATATLEINPPSVAIMDDSTSQPAIANDRDYLPTQYGLLESRTLAERVAQELSLPSAETFVSQDLDRAARVKQATSKLMSNFEVDPLEQSRLIRIHYVSESPTLAAAITNSFADSFIKTNLERRYEASSYARTFLERQIATVKGELEKSERLLVNYAQSQGIINTSKSETGSASDVDSLQGASLVALNQALADAQTKRIAAEQAYRQAGASVPTAEVNESTQPLRQQRAALEAEYQDKLMRMKPDYPDMVSLRSRIVELDRQVAAERKNVASGRANTLLAEYNAAAAAERKLQARVNQLKGAVLNLRGRSIEYNILQREVDTNRTLYDALLQRYKEIGVAGGIGKNLVSVVDRAEPPTMTYKPNLILNLLIGLGLGLIVGIGVALILEFVNDTVKSPDDVRDKLKLTSLGVIPKKQSQETLADELKDQTSPVSEAYFSLRTSLQFSTDSGAPKTLLITSTRPSEGKSSTTLALAQNFSRLGNAVLLIDGDLRKPAFVTGTDSKGLSKLLTNKESIQGHVMATQFENLWLIPCGPLPPTRQSYWRRRG